MVRSTKVHWRHHGTQRGWKVHQEETDEMDPDVEWRSPRDRVYRVFSVTLSAVTSLSAACRHPGAVGGGSSCIEHAQSAFCCCASPSVPQTRQDCIYTRMFAYFNFMPCLCAHKPSCTFSATSGGHLRADFDPGDKPTLWLGAHSPAAPSDVSRGIGPRQL